MKTSKEARKATKSLFQASFVNGQLDEGKVRTVVRELIEKKPRNFLEILKEYQRAVRLELEKRHAFIESATKLDQRTATKLDKSLRDKYGQELTTEFKVAPELIGGLRIKIGSDVWDGSVQARLSRLEEELITT